MNSQKILKICQKCKSSCCGLGGSYATENERKKILSAGHSDFFVKIGKNCYETSCKNGICNYFTKNRSCSIHSVRPLMCRCWPVDIEIRKNKKHFVIVQCPITKLFAAKDLEESKKKLKKIPLGFLKCAYSKNSLNKEDTKRVIERYKKFRKKFFD